MKKQHVYLLLFVFFCSLSARQSRASEESTEPVEGKAKESGLRMIYSPIVYYSPETGLAYGAAGSGIFRLKTGNGRNRPSSLSALVIYTGKKQLRLVATADLYVNTLGLRIRSEITYEDYPDKFFGIGSGTLPEDEEVFTSRKLEMSLCLEKQIWSALSFGVRFQRDDYDITEILSGGLLDSGKFIGIAGGRVIGFGLTMSWDSRDRLYAPTRGIMARARGDLFMSGLGGDYDFSHLRLDFRKYFSIMPGHVLAFQARLDLESGKVPFHYLARFGGMYAMRGYYEGRFRDRNLMMTQLEYRMPLFKRVRLAVFAAAGNVAPTFEQLNFSHPILSGGAGLRFVFDKKEHIVIRMDVGFGKDSSGVYFSIYEAF